MARKLFHPVTAPTGAKVRFDTASGSNTPASDLLTPTDVPIPSGLLRADDGTGALPAFKGPDGVSTLYQKTLDYRGNPTGSPTALTGVLLEAAATPTLESALDPALARDSEVAALLSALPGTFAPIQIVPSIVGDDLVLTIPAGSVYGIDGDGIPYYDPDGAAVGEEALLVVGTDGTTAIVTIGA